MVNLAELSGDILDQILGGSGINVVKLWTAGSPALNSVIASSCTTWISSTQYEKPEFKKWPRMISELRSLKVLLFLANASPEPIQDISNQVKKLSPALTALYLTFDGASTIFFENPAEMMQTALSGTSGDCWDVAKVFPRLETVRLRESMGTYPFSVSTSSFGIFPPTLLELEWCCRISSITLFSLLPAGLQRLDLVFDDPVAKLSPPQVASLPRGLTSLNKVSVGSADGFARLPSSLRDGFWLADHVRFTPATLALLPPGMQNMFAMHLEFPEEEFRGTGLPWTAALPREIIHLGSYSPCLQLRPSDIEYLPKTLTMLRFAFSDDDWTLKIASVGAEALQKMWPPILSCINLDFLKPISPKFLSVLPDSLTQLVPIHIRSETRELFDGARLPPKLTRLSVLQHSSSEVPQQYNISEPMPLGLKELTMSHVYLSASSLPFLPSGLTALGLPHMTLSSPAEVDMVKSMPKSLTFLEVRSIASAALPIIPSTLKELSVRSITGMVHQTMYIGPQRVTVADQPNSHPLVSNASGRFHYWEPLEE